MRRPRSIPVFDSRSPVILQLTLLAFLLFGGPLYSLPFFRKGQTQGESSHQPAPGYGRGLKAGWNKNLVAGDVPYDVFIPPKATGRTLLVLPGWNFPKESWIQNSPLERYAREEGYALVLPQMLQSLYESEYYPETRLKWNRLPGGRFIREVLIPELQTKHGLMRREDQNNLLGLSTGGRGVALIALENPGLFTAAASLSGDYSQNRMPGDNLMTALYGLYSRFPERWKGRDNPESRAQEWSIPLYLAHGDADQTVPVSQSRHFYEALVTAGKQGLPVVYHEVKGAGHNYGFWGGELPSVFRFFENPDKYQSHDTVNIH